MITYKNITDVEVLNEMPEGATALVNDGGELKQVGCEKFRKKEIPTVIASYDGENFSIDMPFDELWTILHEDTPVFAFFHNMTDRYAWLPVALIDNGCGKILFCSDLELEPTYGGYGYHLCCCYGPDNIIYENDPNSCA